MSRPKLFAQRFLSCGGILAALLGWCMVEGGPAQSMAQAAEIASTPYRVAYSSVADRLFLQAEVHLDACAEPNGVRRRLDPARNSITGFAVFLHTGHPFSVRTRYWSEINATLSGLPPGLQRNLDFSPLLDELDKGFLLTQAVVKVVLDGALVPLILDHDVRSTDRRIIDFVYHPACSGDYPVEELPDHYPTLVIKLPEGDVASQVSLQDALRRLRLVSEPGDPLPLFDAGSPDLSTLANGQAVRLFEATAPDGRRFRQDIQYQAFLAIADEVGDAAFLREQKIPANLFLLGGILPLQRSFEVRVRPPFASVAEPAPDPVTPSVAALQAALEAAEAEKDRMETAVTEAEAEQERLRRELTALAEVIRGRDQALAVSDEEIGAVRRELAEVRRQLAAVEAGGEGRDGAPRGPSAEGAGGGDGGSAARSADGAGSLRLLLPDLFSDNDLSGKLRFLPGGACAGAQAVPVPGDARSYAVPGCNDPGAKRIVIGGFAPIERTGLTVVLNTDDLVVAAVEIAGAGWVSYRSERGQPEPATVTNLPLSRLAAQNWTVEYAAFPDMPADRQMAAVCRARISLPLQAVLDGSAAPRQVPPCRVLPLPFAPDWFTAPGTGVNDCPSDGSGGWTAACGCLDSASADYPVCAKPFAVRDSAVTVRVGPGWAPVRVAPENLTTAGLSRVLKPVWPFAEYNPADPDLPDRPDYRLAEVTYRQGESARCRFRLDPSDSGGRAEDDNPLPTLFAPVDCTDGVVFSVNRLPDVMDLVFRQAPPSENLYYSQQVERSFPIDAELRGAAAPFLDAETLLQAYPVLLDDRPPVAGPDAVVRFHASLAACEARPAGGALGHGAYQVGQLLNLRLQAQVAGTAAEARTLDPPYAVIFKDGYQVTQCSPGVPRKLERGSEVAGAENIGMVFSGRLRRLPGSRSVLLVGASTSLKQNGQADLIKEAIEIWLADIIEQRARSLPFTLLSTDGQGNLRIVLQGEDFETADRPTPAELMRRTVMPALESIRFDDVNLRDLRVIDKAYRSLYDYDLASEGRRLARFVYIGDARTEEFIPADLAPLVVFKVLDEARIGVVSQRDCADTWQSIRVPGVPRSGDGPNLLTDSCLRLPNEISRGPNYLVLRDRLVGLLRQELEQPGWR